MPRTSPSSRLAALLAGALAISSFGAACDADDPAPGPPSSPVDGGVVAEAAPAGDGSLAEAGPVARAFELVDEPDTPCARSRALARPFAVTPPPTGELWRLGVAGARRVAEATDESSFVVFDRDGAAPSSPIRVGVTTRVVRGGGDDVLAVGVDEAGSVTLRRHTPSGTATGADVALGVAPFASPFAARDGARTLVVFGDSPVVTARLVEGDVAGEPVALEREAAFSNLTAGIAPSRANDGSAFLVVWALYREPLLEWRSYAALVGPRGVVGLPRVLYGAGAPLRVVGLEATAEGAALLLSVDSEPVVVRLDALGRPTAPAHRLLGARDPRLGGGHGLAVRGDALGVVARHASGAHAFRRLALDGAPVGGWVCLDDVAPDEAHAGGLVADDAGWSLLVARPGGAALLRTSVDGLDTLP